MRFGGITLIGKALYGVADLLAQRPSGDRMVILLTDGESSDIKSPKDSAVIAELRAQNITVFAIMLSNDEIEPALVGIARHGRRSLQRRHARGLAERLQEH